MELSLTSRLGVENLLYGVQFDPEPIESIGHIIKHVVRDDRARYAAIIREALGSETQLSSLLPQPHSEAVIHKYLSEMLARLTT